MDSKGQEKQDNIDSIKMTENVEDEVNTVIEDEVSTVAGNIDNIVEELKEFYNNITINYKKVTKELKNIRKDVAKMEKKKNAKRKGSSNSGIQKKVPISEELSEFFGLEKDTLIARTQVNTLMSKYIKDNELQNSENGQILELDNSDAGRKLKKLLSPPDDVVLTYFKMQTYLKNHYPSVGSSPAVVAEEKTITEEKGTTEASDSKKKLNQQRRRVRSALPAEA